MAGISWRFTSSVLIATLASAGSGALAEGKIHRIVSLAPSNSELLCAIDAQSDIVGTCINCNFPPELKNKERVGSFVSINFERLARVKPDVVLLVSGQEALASALKHNGYKSIVLPNTDFKDIEANLITIGKITNHESQSGKANQRFQQRLTSLEALIKQSKHQPTVFYCVWAEPLLTVGKGTFLNSVITKCGARNIASESKTAYPHFNEERLLAEDPDLIIVSDEKAKAAMVKKIAWRSLKAVQNNQVYVIPADVVDSLSRPSLRITTGMSWLASILHPELKERLDQWNKSDGLTK